MTQENNSRKVNLAQYNSSPTLEGAATWNGGPAIIHQNVTLLDCVSETVLEEALAATDLKEAVVRRISPQAVLVDPAVVEELIKALTKRGYEPKVIRAEGK